MKFKLVLAVVFLLVFAIIILEAQQIQAFYQQVGELEDYSFIQCNTIYQDSRGFLWIGTNQGLDCWDGSRMHSYPFTPFDSLGQPSRAIIYITEDNRNNLWMIGDNLIKYNLELEEFTSIPLYYEEQELFLNHIKCDPDGKLWLGSSQGMFWYYPDQDSLIKISLVDPNGVEITKYPPGIAWKYLEWDREGFLWMIDYQLGLFLYDGINNKFRQQSIDFPDFLEGEIHFTDLKIDSTGSFWILGNRGELTKFDPNSRTFQWVELFRHDHLSPTVRGGLTVDLEGQIWFGIDRGLMHYDPFTKILTAMDPEGVPPMVMDLITDTHGNVIIATLEGVKMLDKQASKIFTLSFNDYILEKGINWITGVVRDDQTFWIGTYNRGLIRYNAKTNVSKLYHADGKPGSLDFEMIDNVLKDQNGRIWIISLHGHVQRYDPAAGSFVTFMIHPNRVITQDKDGAFWILEPDHLLHFDPVTLDSVSYHFEEPLPLTDLRSLLDWVAFTRDDDGIFWFGQQDGGLYRINPESRTWNHYSYDPENLDGLPDNSIRDIFCDSQGRIWLSSGPGLSRIIKNPVNETEITFENSYITDLNLGKTIIITEDRDGNIWVGAFNGVNVIRPDGTIEFFSSANGLPKNPFMINQNSCDPETGEMYLGSVDLAILAPDFLKTSTYIPAVYMTDFSLAGQRVIPGEDSQLKKSMLFTERIDLDHDQNFFRLEFACLNFAHPERNQYKYFLKGIDQDTIHSGNTSYAEYTDLAPGNYTFWVTGSNDSGIWNPEGQSLEIIIHPPWYGSKAAISVYFISMLLLVLGYVRFRTEKLLKEKIMLETQVNERTAEIREKNEKIVEMERLKTRFFTDVSHEIRTPLSLISGPLEVLLKQEYPNPNTESRLSMIKRNTQRVLQLVNQLLDVSRLDSGQMKLVLENTDVMSQIEVLAYEYQSLAEKNHICYILDIQESGNKVWNDRDKIDKVLTNLLSNSFKFTPEFGTITCRVKIQLDSNDPETQMLRIIVADTGQGIPQGEQERIFDRFYRAAGGSNNHAGGTGIGLSLTREMVKLLHGDIRVKSLVGKGTVFMVTLPLGLKHLKKDEYLQKKEEKLAPQINNLQSDARGAIPNVEVATHAITILIVEDNYEVRSFIKENLQPNNKVLEAEDGLKGLALATTAIPDIIISDIMMPGLDGIKLCAKLKNDERTSHIPLIMLTARATTHDKIEGLECGADDYIFKPFSMEEIETRIRNLLEQRERLRKKYSSYIGLDWSEITVKTPDELFLRKVTGTIAKHLQEFTFDVSSLQEHMSMSESTLYKKLKALTGESPSRLIRIMRLKRAATMIEKNEKTITNILMSVGFSSPSYFSRCFKAYFRQTPKAYQKSFHKTA